MLAASLYAGIPILIFGLLIINPFRQQSGPQFFHSNRCRRTNTLEFPECMTMINAYAGYTKLVALWSNNSIIHRKCQFETCFFNYLDNFRRILAFRISKIFNWYIEYCFQ